MDVFSIIFDIPKKLIVSKAFAVFKFFFLLINFHNLIKYWNGRAKWDKKFLYSMGKRKLQFL